MFEMLRGGAFVMCPDDVENHIRKACHLFSLLQKCLFMTLHTMTLAKKCHYLIMIKCTMTLNSKLHCLVEFLYCDDAF